MTNQEKLFLSKQAMFGIGKGISGIPWREGVQVGAAAMPSTAGYGALLGGLGNAILGDEDEELASRILKGLLYGAGGGAAASIPLGIGAMAGVDKTIGAWLRRRQAMRDLNRMQPKDIIN